MSTAAACPRQASIEPAVHCQGVGFVYPDGARALDRVDLEIQRGELLCLLGRNGAGKTTLIRQITAELQPSEGRIRVLGRSVRDDPAGVKQLLGIIPQSAGLFEGLRVDEHLAYFGPLKGLSRPRTRAAVERVLGECDLAALRTKRVGTLSGGERRKVLVALALLAAPEILVLDEPTVGLDPVARRVVWGAIRRQRDAGYTVLLTTHYLDEAEQLADRVAILDHGRLRCTGTLAELHELIGKTLRVARLDPETSEPREQWYVDSPVQAQQIVREQGLDSYAVNRVSLEDIFLRVTGQSTTTSPCD